MGDEKQAVSMSRLFSDRSHKHCSEEETPPAQPPPPPPFSHKMYSLLHYSIDKLLLKLVSLYENQIISFPFF